MMNRRGASAMNPRVIIQNVHIRLAAGLLAVFLVDRRLLRRRRVRQAVPVRRGSDARHRWVGDLVVNASLAGARRLTRLPVPDDRERVDATRSGPLFESRCGCHAREPSWRRRATLRSGPRQVEDIRRLVKLRRSPGHVRVRSARIRANTSSARSSVHLRLQPGTLKNFGWAAGAGRLSRAPAEQDHLPQRPRRRHQRAAADERGNILAWEQHLSDRLEGQPVDIHVEMESQSILTRTLWLFAGAFIAAVLVLIALVWWTMQRGGSGRTGGRP